LIVETIRSVFNPPAKFSTALPFRRLPENPKAQKHQISVALCLRRERSKFPTSHTKSRQSRERVLFHAFQAQGNPTKICWGHVAIPIRQREYRISPLAHGMCLPLGGGSRATVFIRPF